MPSPFGGGVSGGMGMSPFGLAAGGGGTPGKGHDAWRIGLQFYQSDVLIVMLGFFVLF